MVSETKTQSQKPIHVLRMILEDILRHRDLSSRGDPLCVVELVKHTNQLSVALGWKIQHRHLQNITVMFLYRPFCDIVDGFCESAHDFVMSQTSRPKDVGF